MTLQYNVYPDTDGDWRWRLLAANNRSIAVSGEGYHNRADCISAIKLVMGSGSAPIDGNYLLGCSPFPYSPR